MEMKVQPTNPDDRGYLECLRKSQMICQKKNWKKVLQNVSIFKIFLGNLGVSPRKQMFFEQNFLLPGQSDRNGKNILIIWAKFFHANAGDISIAY